MTQPAWPQRLARALRGYFFIEGSPLPLALFRVGFGLTLLYEAHHNFRRIAYYTPETFHFPYTDAVTPLPLDLARRVPADDLVSATLSQLAWPNTIELLFGWELVFAALVVVGLFTRVSLVGLLLTQGYAFLICQLNFRNHVYLMLLLGVLLLLAPCNRTLSLDAGLRALWRKFTAKTDQKSPQDASHDRRAWVPLVAQRMIGLQVCLVYFWATLHKLQPGFLSGYPMGKAVSRAIPRATPLQALLEPAQIQALSDLFANPKWQPLLAYLTVFTEGFLAIGLLFRSTRIAAIVLGLGLHVSILLSMDIRTFGAIMCAAYFCFWVPYQRPMRFEGDSA